MFPFTSDLTPPVFFIGVEGFVGERPAKPAGELMSNSLGGNDS